jgi:FAD/FMN-containing dehydrogenase
VGYSLGGGLGWLARKYGLQCNSVTAIDVVTADGLLLRCDHEHEPDLFWALRGGGGNFGVVTAIEFRVYPVESVYAGSMFFPFARAGEVARAWRDLLSSLPDELTSQFSLMHVPDVPFAPEPMRGQSFAVLSAALTGDERRGRELLEPVRSLGPAMDTFAVAPPAVLAELSMDPPNPLPYASTHALLDGVSDVAVDELALAGDPASGIVSLQLRHLGGALARASAGAGARATLGGSLAMFAVGIAADEASLARLLGSLERVDTACAPHHAGQYASFVEKPADARAFYDAGTWAALRGVKALYDPADLIHGNHHIPPSR